MTSQFLNRTGHARFVFFTLTILTTGAVASEPGSPTALPDAPSATLAPRFQTTAEDRSKAPPLPASSDESTSDQNARPSALRRVMRDQKEPTGDNYKK